MVTEPERSRDADHQRTARVRYQAERGAQSGVVKLVAALEWALPRWGILAVVLGGLALSLALTAGAGEVYDAVTEDDGIAAIDRPVLDWVLTWRTADVGRWATGFTDIGGPVLMPVVATAATLALAWVARSWVPVVTMLIAAGGSLVMTLVSKPLIGRLRPPRVDAVPPFESSGSFPSGHTLNATVIAGLLVYLILLKAHRRVAIWAVTLLGVSFIAAMGLSRVVLGHHWLSDVVAAWLLGLGWLAAVITGHELWRYRRRSASPDRTTTASLGGAA